MVSIVHNYDWQQTKLESWNQCKSELHVIERHAVTENLHKDLTVFFCHNVHWCKFMSQELYTHLKYPWQQFERHWNFALKFLLVSFHQQTLPVLGGISEWHAAADTKIKIFNEKCQLHVLVLKFSSIQHPSVINIFSKRTTAVHRQNY